MYRSVSLGLIRYLILPSCEHDMNSNLSNFILKRIKHQIFQLSVVQSSLCYLTKMSFEVRFVLCLVLEAAHPKRSLSKLLIGQN